MKKYKNIRRMISLCLSLVCVASVSVFPCDAVKYTDWDKLPPKNIDITELPPPSSDYWTLNVYHYTYEGDSTGSYCLGRCDSWEEAFKTPCRHYKGSYNYCESTEYSVVVREPSCDVKGKVGIYCGNGDLCLYRLYPDLPGDHEYDSEQIIIEPGEFKVGKKVKHCSKCGWNIQTDIMPLGVPGPEDSDFWTISRSGYSDWDSVLEDHCGFYGECWDYELEGYNSGYCTSELGIEAEAPSCTSWGYVIVTCGNEHNSMRPRRMFEHNYPELGHDPSDAGFVIEEPTCTRPGKAFKHCLRCERDYEETIQALWHDYQWKTTSPITGTNSGLDELACTRCSDVSKRRIVQNIPGDADLSGSVNASDLLLMKQSFAGVESLTENQQILSDVNKNGSADARDVIQLKKLFAGIIDTLE